MQTEQGDWRQHFGSFNIETPPETCVDGFLASQDFKILNLSTKWHDALGSYSPAGHQLVASRTPVTILQCCYGKPTKTAYRFAGDVIWMPPGVNLNCHWSEGSQKTVACTFDLDHFLRRAGIEWDWNDSDLVAGLDIRSDYMRVALQHIAEEVEAPGLASQLQLECSLLLLCIELCRHFSQHSEANSGERGKLTTSHLKALRDLVEGDLPVPGSVEEMARALGLTPRKLSEMFKNTTGFTLRTYVAQARIRAAQNLLLDPKLLMKQVAYRSGFDDASSFAAAFRRSTGLTPSEFRQAQGVVVPS